VVERKLKSLGATPSLRLKPDGQPYVTDNGNLILDASFGKIADPPGVARSLSNTPGVVEHGLFIGFAKLALVGRGHSVVEMQRRPKPKTTLENKIQRRRPRSIARKKRQKSKRSQP
jgi:ribose 5-phosphate isomerase A